MSTTFLADPFERKYVKPHMKGGRTLVVGSFVTAEKEDRRKRYRDAIGVDMRPGPGVDLVMNMEAPPPADLGQFAHVECWSVLEHSRRPWKLAANIERLMAAGSTLHLTVPFVWRFHDYPSDYWRFTAEGVRELFPGIDWQALMYASDRLRSDPFLRAAGEDHLPLLPRCEVLGFGVKR